MNSRIYLSLLLFCIAAAGGYWYAERENSFILSCTGKTTWWRGTPAKPKFNSEWAVSKEFLVSKDLPVPGKIFDDWRVVTKDNGVFYNGDNSSLRVSDKMIKYVFTKNEPDSSYVYDFEISRMTGKWSIDQVSTSDKNLDQFSTTGTCQKVEKKF